MFSSIYVRLSLLWPTYLPCFCVETYSSYKTNLGPAIWQSTVKLECDGMVFGPVWYNLFRKEYNFVSLELPDFTCFLLLQLPCMCLRFPRHIVGIIFSKYGSNEHTPESETSHPKITQIEKSNHLPSSFFSVGFHEKIFPSVPSWELTYPPKMAFWRWFSFSQGGIC